MTLLKQKKSFDVFSKKMKKSHDADDFKKKYLLKKRC